MASVYCWDGEGKAISVNKRSDIASRALSASEERSVVRKPLMEERAHFGGWGERGACLYSTDNFVVIC